MTSPVYWILDADENYPGRLAIVLRPGGAESLAGDIGILSDEGIRLLLSLLPPEESGAMGLEREGEACEAAGLRFLNFPMRDFGVPPSLEQGAALIEDLVAAMQAGEHVGIHCRGSVGRSGTISSAVLVRLGFSPEEAFHAVSIQRGALCPETEMQRRWVYEYAQSLR